MTTAAPNPVLVEVLRDPVVESAHRGAACVVDSAGAVVAAWGDIDRPVPPRSAIKPLQALPLIETGAADACGYGAEEIALACASHSATPRQTALVRSMLERVGLDEGALACGGQPPLDREADMALARAGQPWTRLHDNCSGKHAGFLATAVHLGEPVVGYHLADHPVQRRIAAVLDDLCGVRVDALPRGIDGCGIPVWSLPLRALARGLAGLARPAGLALGRAAAARRVAAAVAMHPDLVAGPDRFDTALMSGTGGRILAKGGAEGVQVAWISETGLGIAIKVDDGGGRAAGVALGGVLRTLDLLLPEEADALADLLAPAVRTRTGAVVGALRARPLSP